MYTRKIDEYALFNTNKEKFEEIYSTEDPWKLRGRQEQFRYRRTIEFIRKNIQKPNMKILELGCSEGHFTAHLSKQEYRITAVDISEKAIQRAKKKNIPNAEFICADMIQFIANSELATYDLIIILECIYYLDKMRKAMFLEILHEKINSDAKVIISLPVNKDNEMFISEKRILKKFGQLGFGLYKNYYGVILSSKGKTGKLLEFIPFYGLKKLYLYAHKYLFPFRINQKLFLFRKD
ncbi:MAG: class I SAM-dependent methyltransferase [Ignavibacteriae bacterium]|nr:class I SAM-dependent methyltransferase [Ignavibacteriota bacterium]